MYMSVLTQYSVGCANAMKAIMLQKLMYMSVLTQYTPVYSNATPTGSPTPQGGDRLRLGAVRYNARSNVRGLGTHSQVNTQRSNHIDHEICILIITYAYCRVLLIKSNRLFFVLAISGKSFDRSLPLICRV